MSLSTEDRRARTGQQVPRGAQSSAVTVQCHSTGERATRLRALRDDYRARMATPRASALLPTLVDSLFASPATTIAQARLLLGVTHRAATMNVEKLMSSGILTEVAGRGRARLFLATEILDTLATAPSPPGDPLD